MISTAFEFYLALMDKLFPLLLWVYPFDWVRRRYTIVGAWLLCLVGTLAMAYLGNPEAFFPGFLTFLLSFFLYGELAPDSHRRDG